MDFAAIPRSAYRWTLEQICEFTVSVALAVSVSCLVTGPLEPHLATWFGRALETRIPSTDLAQVSKISGIIVLGGAVKRVEAALEIAETFPGVPVILSGPGDIEIQRATRLDEASGRLVINRRPKSTYQNARYAREHMSPHPAACWILVTSALHMPRALGTFQAMSLPVLPWLVDDTPSVPRALSGPVWHEVRGLIAYRLLGITDQLFPGLKPSRLVSPRTALGSRSCSLWP